MNGLSVTFDGIELSDYLKVTDLQRDIGTSRTNKTVKVGNSDGESYLGSTLEKKIIPMSFNLRYDLTEKRRELAHLLNVDEPKMLIFGDEPDKYYMAIPDGEIPLPENNFLGNGTINWLVVDGVAHAVEYSEVPQKGQGMVDISNNGSYKSYPILEAKMSSDNGFVGFINQDGAILQFGNPDEPDTVDYIESDRVVWDTSMVADKEASRGWKTNVYQFSELWLGKHRLNANGTRVFDSNATLNYIQAGSYGTGSSGYKGITYGRKVSPDSQGHVGARDFESRHGVWFETGTVKQTGLFLTELRDKDGKQVCSVAFYKLSSSTNDARIRINVRNNIQEFKFEPNAWNAFTKMGKEFSILKIGSKLTFRLGNASDSMIIFSMDIDSVRDAEVTDIVYYIGVPISGTPLTRMYLTRSTLRKDNVDKIRDIKNVFGEDDILTIDTSKGRASVNGIEIFGLGALGNEYEAFTLKPGKNKIQCINSDWVKNPVEYTIKWRDAYL